MLSGRDCISCIMMGVSRCRFIAVILNADALAAPAAEIFNTVNLGVENDSVMTDNLTTLINHGAYHDCVYIKTGSTLSVSYTQGHAVEKRWQIFRKTQSILNNVRLKSG